MAEAQKKKKIFDGRYEVLSIVGRGAASVVYHARHATALTSEVALKVLVSKPAKPGQPKNSDRLRKEALAMVSSRHKYVVRLDDFHSVGDLCYLAMEYAPYGDLRKYVASAGGRLNTEQAELFLTQSAEALDFIHRVGIVHRDIKPDNILVVNEKEIRLADFGVSVLPGERATLEELQAGVGTMNYMAPEVLEGRGYDKRSDIYSLGVAFYELITGVHPFDQAPLIQQLEVRQDNVITPPDKLVPGVPSYLSAVLLQAMSYDAEKRFPTVKDLIQSLLVNKAQSGQVARPAEAIPAPAKPRPRADTQGAGEQPATSPFDGGESKTVPFAQRGTAARRSEATAAPPVADTHDRQEVIEPEIAVGDTPKPAARVKTDGAENAAPGRPASRPPRDADQPGAGEGGSSTMKDRLQQLRTDPRGERPVREDVSEPAETPRQKPLPRRTPAAIDVTKRRITMPPLLPLFAIGLVIFAAYKWFEGDSASIPSEQGEVQSSSSPIPDTVGAVLAFPDLPPGMYTGVINDILPGRSAPLSILSIDIPRGLVVTVGLDGWTPRLVPIPAPSQDGEPTSIRVPSNGFILDLSGTTGQTGVGGSFKNLVTGENGKWAVAPAGE